MGEQDRSGRLHGALPAVQAAAADPPTDADEVAAALRLIPQARSELDHAEADLITTGRAAGWSWPAIGRALGLRSGQAAEQRALRLAGAVASNRRDAPTQRRARRRPQHAPERDGAAAPPTRPAHTPPVNTTETADAAGRPEPATRPRPAARDSTARTSPPDSRADADTTALVNESLTRATTRTGRRPSRAARRPRVTVADFAADDTYGLTRLAPGVWSVTAHGAAIGQVRREQTSGRRTPAWQAWSTHQMPVGTREPTRARAALHLVETHRNQSAARPDG